MKLLVDTSIWIDYLRGGDLRLGQALTDLQVLVHPSIVGELALGTLSQRDSILGSLQNLPSATVATDQEVLRLIEAFHLHGRGIGYLDAHLIASSRLTPDVRLWTRDKRLAEAAADLDIGFDPV